MPTYTVTLTLKVTTKEADAAKVKAKIGDPKVLERMQNKVEYGASQIEVVDVKVESVGSA
jgi:acetoacetate decarboxylase